MIYRKKPVEVEVFRLGYDPMPDWFMNERTMNNVITMFKNNYKPEPPIRGLFNANRGRYKNPRRHDAR